MDEDRSALIRCRKAYDGGVFVVRGAYRVQSRRERLESEFRGRWVHDGRITSACVNAWLTTHSLWQGQRVDVRSAEVTYRSGAFTQADALYYRDHFTTTDQAYDLPCNVIDVTKLEHHWTRRVSLLRGVFDAASWSLIESRVENVARTASDEYHVHEAGHALGWSVQEKARAGYFQITGSTVWPLVFVEELRADLGSFAAALDLLDAEAAIGVFLYCLAHRFGLAAETIDDLSLGVPYLLFGVCREHGALEVGEDGSVRVVTDALPRSMRTCAELAAHTLTAPDVRRDDAADAAVNAVAFFRRYALDAELAHAYRCVFERERLSQRMDQRQAPSAAPTISSTAR